MSLPWLITAGFSPGRFLWLLVCYAWPVVPTLVLVAATTRRDRIAINTGYFAIVALVAGFVLARNDVLTLGELIFFWIFANGAGTVLLLTFLNRRVRAVGPIVLTFMVAGVTGAFVLVSISGESDSVLRALVTLGDMMGLGASALFVLMHVAGFVVFAFLGWRLLGWLGRRYQTKSFSDQSLTVDSTWLLFGIVQSITLAFEGWGWIFTGLVAFAAHYAITHVGFGWASRSEAHDREAPTLLLLRVFALGRRSERFFDDLSKWWRRTGSMSLISGPDLVTTVVEPHEFLDFVGGRLSRQFVQGEADLERRLAGLDTELDPDGRYRVNEFFCHADTWQMTMRALASRSDVVVMDLRSFSPDNQGCQYELEQLIDIVDLARVVLIVDETTDRPFLEDTLQELWRGVASDSPNLLAAAPCARLLDLSQASSTEVIKLLSTMLPSRDIRE